MTEKRQTQFARVMDYFRTADLTEASAAIRSGDVIVTERQTDANEIHEATTFRKTRTRRPAANGAEVRQPAQPTTQELFNE
jgi:hypothetical protein